MAMHIQAQSAANGCSLTHANTELLLAEYISDLLLIVSGLLQIHSHTSCEMCIVLDVTPFFSLPKTHPNRMTSGFLYLWFYLFIFLMSYFFSSPPRMSVRGCFCPGCLILTVLFIYLFTYLLTYSLVLISTWRMTWCASSTIRLMTSWTVWLRSRPLWSPPLYLQSSHHLWQTRRGTNSGAAI